MQTSFTLKRAKEARAQFGIGGSSFYEMIQRGLLPPGIKLGLRSTAWPSYELDAIARARIAGKSEDQIRALVRTLIAARAQAGA